MMPSRNSPQKLPKAQRGAIFLVMIVVLTVGIIATLIGALSKVGLQTVRNEKSSDMLAQAKEVVIGYAVSATGGGQYPGDLTLPDRLVDVTPNYDGVTDSCPALQLSPTPTGCLGRLPWQTLGMSISHPSENDPIGFMPWYAISANLAGSPSVTLNSELLNSAPHNWLSVRDMNGNVLSNRVAFVVIIPNAPVNGQARSASPNLGGADQYLDSITVGGITYSNADADDSFIMGDEHRWIDDPANPGKQIEDSTYNFNDKLIYVTIDELMPLIEKRIAREVKNCLDDYAAWPTNTNHRYPWATLVTDTSYPRSGTYNVHFGRLSDIPSNATSSGTPITADDIALQNKIIELQTALSNYLDGTGTLSNLRNKGDALKDFARDPPYNQNFFDPARYAGWYAENCAGMSCTGTLASLINTALDAIPTGATTDNTMPTSWATIPSCKQLIVDSSYWPEWRDLVFYQVADGYQPGGGTWTPLHISGSGNPVADNNTYRAAVVIAGKMLSGQSPRTQTNPPTTYLETSGPNSNAHQSAAGVSPNVNFITYKSSDTAYSTVNDFVLCVDGKTNCK